MIIITTVWATTEVSVEGDILYFWKHVNKIKIFFIAVLFFHRQNLLIIGLIKFLNAFDSLILKMKMYLDFLND